MFVFRISNMFMKNLLLIILIVLASVPAFAQTTGISGKVTDSTGSKGLEKATVKLVEKDLPKDTLRTITNAKGEFSFTKIPASAYSIIISYSGYKPMVKEFFKPSAGVSNIDLGELVLTNTYLDLAEIVIEAPAVTMKEDTVEYRAGAFQTKPNATTEELLKKLPGVQVDRQGNITAHGKQVTRVKVNGKDFFNGDPKTATQEIPADMIDKVQVVDDYGDQSNASGIRDGEPEKVINLQLKKDKNKGVFGRAMVGYGTDDRYIGAVALNRFNNSKQLSLIINSNNNNTSTFRANDGGGGGGGGGMQFGGGGNQGGGGGNQNGITKLNSIGLNFRTDFGKRNSFYGSYTYTDRNTFTESYTSKEQLSFPLLTNTNQFSTNKNGTHRVFANLEYWIDSFNYIKLNPNFSYTDGNNVSTNFSDYFSSKLQTRADSNQTAVLSKRPDFSTSLLYNHRFKKRGRNFSFNGQLTLSGSESDQLRENYTHFYDNNGNFFRDSLQFRNTIQNNRNSGFNGRLTYTEPIRVNRFLDLSYNYNRSFSGNNKRVLTKDPLTGNDYAFVDYLSNNYETDFNYNRISAAVRTVMKKYNYSIGIMVQPVILNGYSITKDSAYKPITNFNWFPVARFQYNFSRSKTFNFNYNGSARQPSFDQLQPVLEESSQLNKSSGNPFLKPSTSHVFNTTFNNFNFGSGKIFLVNASFNFVDNQIVNKVTNFKDSANRFTGATFSQPVNVDGYYNANMFINYGRPFKNRKYVLGLRSMLNYNNNVSLSNNVTKTRTDSIVGPDIKNMARNWIWSPGVDFEYNLPWLELRTGASYNLNYTDNTNNKNISRLHTITLSNDGRIDFGAGFILRWDFDYFIYEGLTSSLQKNIAMLNASFEKEVFKKKNGIIKLAGFDIFKQNTSISRTQTDQFITDNRTNRLTQYFMLSFTYRFNKFSGTQGGQQNNNFRRAEGRNMMMMQNND
ncbi:outer membrane receptor protein involved in Fe transport [Lacibacter cauensis]|uniref:Outer membrane receptor protein involved in Fe transport n=2 Tax=Lacibacter cauensis TaxID=510947 RepID=A0A562SII0_9BACT|nr:outer membrane receptor protein involved in Fe transport [Lacibacter cauensis]